jgi:hypothetical protein
MNLLSDLVFLWVWNTTICVLVGAPVLGIVFLVAYLTRPQDG